VIALSLFQNDELSLLNSRICASTKFTSQSSLYGRARRDVVWRNVRALDLLEKKTGSLLALREGVRITVHGPTPARR
jgi:hypothetical protein